MVGASSGIGRAFAELAIAEGAWVVAAARRGGLLEELVVALAGILGAGLANPGVAIEHVRLRSPSAPATSVDDLEL